MATITVRGTGTVQATPDEATLDLGVEAGAEPMPVEAEELAVVAVVDVELNLDQG